MKKNDAHPEVMLPDEDVTHFEQYTKKELSNLELNGLPFKLGVDIFNPLIPHNQAPYPHRRFMVLQKISENNHRYS